GAEEAEVDGLRTEPEEVLNQPLLVVGADRADVHRAAVTQNAVGGEVARVGAHGAASWPRRVTSASSRGDVAISWRAALPRGPSVAERQRSGAPASKQHS